MKGELDLSNYAIIGDLKSTAGVDTSKFAKKVDLANLKSNVDKLDIDKFKNVPSGLSSLKFKNVPSDLSSLNSKVDKLDIRKLKTTPVDLSKITNVFKNDIVKKT